MADLAVSLLLIFGVAVEWLCCLGVLLARNPYARLHFLGPASLLGPPAFAAAILIQSPGKGGLKAVLIAAALLVINPIVSHATARAVHARPRPSGLSGEKRETCS